nr:zinc finger, CCHC-type, retrotransposon Gag domain protein [Tanacetum cinerariifolium]
MVNRRTDADLSAAVQTPCRHCFPRFAQRFARSSVPILDRRMLERLKREYHSIRQTNTENSTEFMQRFLRLAGFLGAAAGTEEEQALY